MSENIADKGRLARIIAQAKQITGDLKVKNMSQFAYSNPLENLVKTAKGFLGTVNRGQKPREETLRKVEYGWILYSEIRTLNEGYEPQLREAVAKCLEQTANAAVSYVKDNRSWAITKTHVLDAADTIKKGKCYWWDIHLEGAHRLLEYVASKEADVKELNSHLEYYMERTKVKGTLYDSEKS